MAKAMKHAAAGKARASAELGAVIDDLVVGNRILYDQNVVDGYGHISARDPRDPDRFLLSRARAPGLVTAADIMEFGRDGEPIRDDGRPIYSERFIHSEIYKAREDVNSVVHSHSPTVVPFTVTQVPLKPIRAAFFYPEVPLFDTRAVAGWTNPDLQQVAGMAMWSSARACGSRSIARSTPKPMPSCCCRQRCLAGRSIISRPRRRPSWRPRRAETGRDTGTTASGSC